MPPSEAVHGGFGALQPGNLLILVTKGGRTEELLPLADIAKATGSPILLVTAHPERELGQMADVVLTLPDTPESDRFDMMSTASFAATIGIFDALMMGRWRKRIIRSATSPVFIRVEPSVSELQHLLRKWDKKDLWVLLHVAFPCRSIRRFVFWITKVIGRSACSWGRGALLGGKPSVCRCASGRNRLIG